MNKKIIVSVVLAATFTAFAQERTIPSRPPGDPGGHGMRPSLPLISALDADKSGIIDSSEISGAAQAIAALDVNQDGSITASELEPKRPAGAPTSPADAPKRPMPPLVTVLDSDQDGALSATEVAAASTALASLDRNSDGALTPEEFMGRGRGHQGGPKGGRPPR